MILDIILVKNSVFRAYSTKIRVILDVIPYNITDIVILDVLPQKSHFGRYSAKITTLDVILPEYGDFRHDSSKIQCF